MIDPTSFNKIAFLKTASKMYAISAPLGVALDNYHGLFGVLSYEAKGIPFSLSWNDHYFLKTAIWVPFTFGFAGVVMAWLMLGPLGNGFTSRFGASCANWVGQFFGRYKQ